MDVAGLGQFARACQTRTYLEADNPGSILHFGTPCSHEIVSPPITITFNDHTCKHRTYMQRILNPDPKSFIHSVIIKTQDSRHPFFSTQFVLNMSSKWKRRKIEQRRYDTDPAYKTAWVSFLTIIPRHTWVPAGKAAIW